MDRRDSIGGAFQDRWDGFYMNTTNLSLDLPGMPYDGDDRAAFIPRDAAVNLFRQYAELISAPVHTGVDLTRMSAGPDGGFSLETSLGKLLARNVVLATGAYATESTSTLARLSSATQMRPRPPNNPLPDRYPPFRPSLAGPLRVRSAASLALGAVTTGSMAGGLSAPPRRRIPFHVSKEIGIHRDLADPPCHPRRRVRSSCQAALSGGITWKPSPSAVR